MYDMNVDNLIRHTHHDMYVVNILSIVIFVFGPA